jgi:poly-gamma-glutamate capsule biosynthesis protein CapA/YwtB (metallophosphatase superfamily)
MPRPRARRAARPPEATVLVAADWAPIRAFEPIVRRQPDAVYGDLLPLLRGADLRIVNCECPLTRASRPIWKSGAVFKGEPAHVPGLTAVPFDIACLANNHVLDYGVAGLRETLRVLGRAGIATVGAGLDGDEAHGPLSARAGGLDVHIVNFSEGEDLTASRGGPGVFGWDIPRVQAAVRECRRGGGIVIAIGHCGLEYVPYPPPYVVAAFRAAIDAGADCVIGHHPHVPQGVEWYRGRPIVYSLGNFVFYQPTPLRHRKTGFLVTLRATSRGVRSVNLHPYRITDEGLRSLRPGEARGFHRTMARLSRPFRTGNGHARAWDAYLAYYGVDGLVKEATGILERLQAEPQKAAAMFRNRVTTMQHAELWRDVLTRTIDGAGQKPPRDAAMLIREYFTASVD